jgi:Short C-terminal domain
VAQLEQLALKERGVLTEEEFAAQKARILEP